MIRLQREALDIGEIVRSVSRPTSGAVDVFIGTTRNNAEGRLVRSLEYEAHELMAAQEIEKISARAFERWPIDAVSVVHRLGPVAIGEASVVIAVAAPHRAEAFEACRFVIDTLKKEVPIWKKEQFEDGTTSWPGQPTGKN